MKSLLLSVLLLFLVISPAFCQSYLGIFGGIVNSKFSGDSPKNFVYKSNIKFFAGINYDIRIKEDVFISLMPAYTKSGSKMQVPDQENEVYKDSIDLLFQTIKLPVLMKLISDNKKWQFTGGLDFLYTLSLKADNTVEKVDITDDVNKFNISAVLGVGYRIPIKAQFLTVDLSYFQGITNLANNLKDEDSLLPRIRQSGFQLAVAWLLPIGKKKFDSNRSNKQ